MQCEIVSYLSEKTLAAASGSGIPIRCKFVVILQPDVLSLVWGPLSLFPYHAHLVDRFCSDRLIASHWVKRPDMVAILDKTVFVKGGGAMEVLPERWTVMLGGASKAYGYFSSEDVRNIVASQPVLDGYTLIFA